MQQLTMVLKFLTHVRTSPRIFRDYLRTRRCVELFRLQKGASARSALVCHSWPHCLSRRLVCLVCLVWRVTIDILNTTAPPSAVQAQSAAYTIPITYSIHDHQNMMHRTHDNN